MEDIELNITAIAWCKGTLKSKLIIPMKTFFNGYMSASALYKGIIHTVMEAKPPSIDVSLRNNQSLRNP